MKRLEAAREAETGRVLFASMSVVMNGHVFVENGSGATQMLAILLTVKSSKIVRFKNTGVLPFIREVSGVLTESAFLTYLHGNCTFNGICKVRHAHARYTTPISHMTHE